MTLYDGAKAVGTAKVAGGGTWSVSMASALAAGVHALTARATSATKGVSDASAALKLTIKTAAAVPSGLSFAVAADKGAKGDTMTVGGRGEAGDRVTLYDGKTAIGGATVTAAGTWSLTTASPLAVGAHSLNANEVDVAANKSGGSAAQSLTVVRAAANAVVFVGTAGVDNFTGGAGNDVFEFSAANLADSDTVKGGGGTNELLMTTAGTVRAGGVGGVETYQLANGAANSLTLANLNFAGVTGGTITAFGGNAGNTIDAAAVTGANRVVAVGGAGKDLFTGGAGSDIFQFSAANLASADTVKGGAGADELLMTSAGTVRASGVSGVEIYSLANGGVNSLALTNANFAGVNGNLITVDGGNAGNTINAAALTAADRVAANGGSGKDIFQFSAVSLANSDTVKGGDGTDYLDMTIAGTVAVRGVSGVEVYELANGGANRVTLTNTNFAGVTGGTITVYGGNAGNTVNAAGLTGANRVVVWGGAGKDVLSGGAGNDIFKFTAAALAASDRVQGGAGNNEIDITTPGTVAAGGVGGVETYALANGGADSLTLANINFTGVALHTITVYGGNGGDTISEAGVAAADQVLMRGGAGADTLIAGQNAAMTGGAGKDVFWFTTPGSTKTPDTNTITDFAHAADKIAFSDAGFALGLKGASATPKPLPAALFTANSAGSFGTAAERFAYDTATGALYYDARGNAAGSSRELVASLGGHPTVTAADLFYVS